MPQETRVCMEELLSRPGIRVRPEHVPRFSRPIAANYDYLDGLGYQFLYQDFIRDNDVRNTIGRILMIVGGEQSTESFTPFADMLERMLDGKETANLDALRQRAKELDDWNCREIALSHFQHFPHNVRKDRATIIPFDVISRCQDIGNGDIQPSAFDDAKMDESIAIFGDFFLDLMLIEPKITGSPHEEMVDRLLDGHEYPFNDDLRQLALKLDKLRTLSIQAAIREYWRSSDESEKMGGEPGTLDGMHEYMRKCGVAMWNMHPGLNQHLCH